MIRLQSKPIASLAEARKQLQTAIGVEFGTLPPYLYALYSIPPGQNLQAAERIKSVAMQEMIHMCLACNILNAIGGEPALKPPKYPGPLPGDIGPPGGKPLKIRLYPFSKEAMAQGMAIEEPMDGPIDFPDKPMLKAGKSETVTIGEFYTRLDAYLATLPASDWHAGRNQIDDNQYFMGQLFDVNGYPDAHKAIEQIISEGEGASNSPLDFQQEVAHFYRFEEVFRNQVLTKDPNPKGYAWTGTLGVDWKAVYPAIIDPASHDFSHDPPAARAAQKACDAAFSRMVRELQLAVTGHEGHLGLAVRAMFDLRMAAHVAFTTPLADPKKVAGPSFVYKPGAWK
ncbi:hypothetical protein QO010_002773 [Caulobacter ginsengisoli]|uniref:Iminophenyl-pyruvate dimer synthase domain-containing protein n=1 Tax=Caulobacter ginsengisoli TaxID=400775 RepID=A0ABU0ISM9_9CAUL|nr:ferritin-like protein [Caulobacter ginsengisoli]MDQ0464989.1 hypothetical protein [Caulobacter ginsengisoli]